MAVAYLGLVSRATTLAGVAVVAVLGLATGQTIPTLGPWTPLKNYPIEVFEAQGTLMNCNGAKVHAVFGGFFEFPNTTYDSYIRNIGSNDHDWEPITPMPNLEEGGSHKALTHMAQVVVDDVIYLAGGYLGAHAGPSAENVLAYNCTADEWMTLPNLPERRAGGGMVYVEELNALIFAGGGDRLTQGDMDGVAVHGGILKHIDYGDTWMLELDNPDQWVPLGSGVEDDVQMPDPRNHQGGVMSCGRYYWIGGQHEEDEKAGNRVTCNELTFNFDEVTANWTTIADLPKPLGHISASTMPFNCGIVVVAGVTQELERSNAVYYWDPITDTWHMLGEYPHKLATPVCGIHEDWLFCATGGGPGKSKNYVAQLKLP